MGVVTRLPGKLSPLPDHVRLGIVSRVGTKDLAGVPMQKDGDGYGIVIGEMGQHLATASVPILAVSWVVPNHCVPVMNYAISQQAGVVTPMPPTLTSNPITFAWTAPGATYVGVHITTEHGTAYVENYFYVEGPSVSRFYSQTGQPYAGPFENRIFLRFGNPPGPGIQVLARAACPNDVSGAIAILQLADNQRVGADTDHVSWHWSLNGQLVLDVGPDAAWLFYQNQVTQISAGNSGDIDISDAPATELGPPFRLVSIGAGSPTTPETYHTCLMFRSSAPGAIWVTLAVLTWSWEGYSELEDKEWSPVKEPNNTVNPIGVASNILPTWTTNTNTGRWELGFGQQRPRYEHP